MTIARTLALKCQFTDSELNERLIKLIIASTPFDALRNDSYPASAEVVSHAYATDTKTTLTQGKTTNVKKSIHVKPPRDETYTNLNVKPPLLQGHAYTVRLKIDTGAFGNTLPHGTSKTRTRCKSNIIYW